MTGRLLRQAGGSRSGCVQAGTPPEVVAQYRSELLGRRRHGRMPSERHTDLDRTTRRRRQHAQVAREGCRDIGVDDPDADVLRRVLRRHPADGDRIGCLDRVPRLDPQALDRVAQRQVARVGRVEQQLRLIVQVTNTDAGTSGERVGGMTFLGWSSPAPESRRLRSQVPRLRSLRHCRAAGAGLTRPSRTATLARFHQRATSP